MRRCGWVGVGVWRLARPACLPSACLDQPPRVLGPLSPRCPPPMHPPMHPCQVAKLPRWQSTLTIRALVIGAILGACFSIISLKLGLTTGVIPSLNIAAGLLGFFFLKSLAKGLDYAKLPVKFNPPLSAQEVTVIQVRGAALCYATPCRAARCRCCGSVHSAACGSTATHAADVGLPATASTDHMRRLLRPGLQRRLRHM